MQSDFKINIFPCLQKKDQISCRVVTTIQMTGDDRCLEVDDGLNDILLD